MNGKTRNVIFLLGIFGFLIRKETYIENTTMLSTIDYRCEDKKWSYDRRHWCHYIRVRFLREIVKK